MNQSMQEDENLIIDLPLNFFWEKDESFCIRIQGSPKEEHVKAVLENVVSLFCTFPDQDDLAPEQRVPNFNVLKKMTPDLRKHLIEMCEKMVKKSPQINQAISIFKRVKDGEYFYVYPKLPDDSLQYEIQLRMYLEALNSGLSEEDANQDVKDRYQTIQSLFSTEFEYYDIQAFGETPRKKNIGTKPTEGEGACRFCKLSVKDGAKFKKVAHTISEALGNKQIITKDECDVCNKHFGDEVEPHLIEYLNLHRVYFRIKGK